MALPQSRAEFKAYCLRKLGDGVIDINVSDEQVEDRIDEALYFFREYHDEAIERVFIKVQLTQTDIDNKYITLPSNVIQIEQIIPLSSISSQNSIFSDEFQYWSHNAHEITNSELQYFFVGMRHLEMIQHSFDLLSPFEFNRITRKLYIFDNWTRYAEDDYIALLGFIVIDEAVGDLWSNQFFFRYATALIKRQWGENLSKYDGVAVLGGITFNAARMIQEADDEITKLETQIKVEESAPLDIFIG
jgi:hypothetical protein